MCVSDHCAAAAAAATDPNLSQGFSDVEQTQRDPKALQVHGNDAKLLINVLVLDNVKRKRKNREGNSAQ